MPSAIPPDNELERLTALRQCGILDTPAETEFDEITKAAAEICETPIALISLVDGERQWFKSKVGLCVSQTPRDQAFCAHALHQNDPLIIEDATADLRTRDNPLVTGKPNIRFYAGVQLLDTHGFALGTLCVIDRTPRRLSQAQLDSLKRLARQAEAQIELRRRARENHRLQTAVEGAKSGGRTGMCMTLVAGLSITTLIVIASYRATVAEARQRFERLNARAVSEIERRIQLPVYGMRGARGVYAASKSVERNEMAAYVASRDLPHEFPGAIGMGFIERVNRENLAEFIAAERADDSPTFNVFSISPDAPKLQDLWVIKHVFPAARNAAAWGLDVGSEPIRRMAAERAARSGEPAITAPVTLVQDQRIQRGLLYYLPVYKNGTYPQNDDERLTALKGLVYTPIVIDDTLAGVARACDDMLDFAVFDGSETTGQALFPLGGTEAKATRPASARLFTGASTIGVGGRTWTIQTATTANFNTLVDHSPSILAGVFGALLSLLLAALTWSLGQSRARAFALARSMTADLADARDLAIKRSRDAKDAERESRETAAMLQRMSALANVGGWEYDLVNQTTTWSDEVYRIHELPLATPITIDLAIGFYPPGAREQVEAVVVHALESGTSWDLETPLVTSTGRSIWVRSRGECIREGDRIVRLCGAFQDITTRKAAEELLRTSATHDKLTGLPNRVLLTDRLQQCLKRQTRGRDRTFAVLFMDFDRFKLVNDTLGHEAGDDLLKQIAERLGSGLRPSDSIGRPADAATVGRLGGDEFVVVLDDIACPEDAISVADRLLNGLAAPYRIGGHDVVSTASIGVVTWNQSYTAPEEMLRDADIAMYEAKMTGKGRCVVFDKAMHESVQRRVAIEADLRRALGEQQLCLTYQSVIDLATGKLTGAEVLLRWNHPTRGVIGPNELIPVAEETGLILPIGDWVLETACRQLRQWQDELGEQAPPSITVNLSPKQLAMSDLPRKVDAVLRSTGLAAHCLYFDVKESAIMKDPQLVSRQLESLRAIGVKTAMDDFGTGNSSLAMLHKFPIDVLKIDRSFVANLSQGRAFTSLVSAIVMLARNLDIAVIAEGVESWEQLVSLQTLDCAMAQGHLFGPAVPVEDFQRQLVRRENWNPQFAGQPLRLCA